MIRLQYYYIEFKASKQEFKSFHNFVFQQIMVSI